MKNIIITIILSIMIACALYVPVAWLGLFLLEFISALLHQLKLTMFFDTIYLFIVWTLFIGYLYGSYKIAQWLIRRIKKK